MLRASIRTTGRTWPIRPGEPTFISTMVTRLTGKKGPSRRAPRRKPPLKQRVGRPDVKPDGPFSSAGCNHLRELDELLGSIELLSPLPAPAPPLCTSRNWLGLLGNPCPSIMASG